MATIVKTLISAKSLESTNVTQYTVSAGTKAVIDKATVTNTDTVNRSFSVWLIPQGGTAVNGTLIIDDKTVVPGETYLCPEIVGHELDSGAFINTIASAASALTMRVSGREIT